MENKGIAVIGAFIVDFLRAELEGQGHNNTGKLSESINWKFENGDINIYAEDYGRLLDRGRKPKQTPVPINALMLWVEQRGIASGEEKIKSVAFAIQQKIIQEGSPTIGSFAFSNNGRRKDFITFSFNENEKIILKMVADMFDKVFKAELVDLLTDAKIKYFNEK